MTKPGTHRGAYQRPPETPPSRSWRPGFTQAGIGLGGLVSIILGIMVFEGWSMGQPSTRHEVSQTVAKLQPACRPILQTRFKQKLVQVGRPLTRREVDGLAEGIEDCDEIDQQVAGLNGN